MISANRSAVAIVSALLASIIPQAFAQSAPAKPGGKPAVVAMDDERIWLAEIELRDAGPASIARWLIVPGTIVPDGGRVAHVPVKLSGTVAELRKNIGDDVVKDEVLAVLESREVADAKSEYLAARLSNELQQDLTARDKSLSEGRAVPKQRTNQKPLATVVIRGLLTATLLTLVVLPALYARFAALAPTPGRIGNVAPLVHNRAAE